MATGSKPTKEDHRTSTAVDSKEVSRDITHNQQQPFSHNSHRHQHNTGTQAAEITNMKSELNSALEENQNLKEMFNPHWLVEAISKVVGNITMKEGPKPPQGTQYQGNSNYVRRLGQPQLAHGANGTLELTVTCHYCRDRGHIKDNCVCLCNKIAHDMQLQ